MTSHRRKSRKNCDERVQACRSSSGVMWQEMRRKRRVALFRLLHQLRCLTPSSWGGEEKEEEEEGSAPAVRRSKWKSVSITPVTEATVVRSHLLRCHGHVSTGRISCMMASLSFYLHFLWIYPSFRRPWRYGCWWKPSLTCVRVSYLRTVSKAFLPTVLNPHLCVAKISSITVLQLLTGLSSCPSILLGHTSKHKKLFLDVFWKRGSDCADVMLRGSAFNVKSADNSSSASIHCLIDAVLPSPTSLCLWEKINSEH